ncbi:MAG: hypothetical protein U5L09_03045 [Bacteroidales bacterium]|nr:hypothetical protein [Bacteroidales bacterium]
MKRPAQSLVALYFATDPKLIELGLMDNEEVGKAEYDAFMRSALLTQLVRVEPGKNIEEAHMRNRYLIAQWILQKGAHQQVILKKVKEGKTYYSIGDYELFRDYVGILLREGQRIKSEGDVSRRKAVSGNLRVEVIKLYIMRCLSAGKSSGLHLMRDSSIRN